MNDTTPKPQYSIRTLNLYNLTSPLDVINKNSPAALVINVTNLKDIQDILLNTFKNSRTSCFLYSRSSKGFKSYGIPQTS